MYDIKIKSEIEFCRKGRYFGSGFLVMYPTTLGQMPICRRFKTIFVNLIETLINQLTGIWKFYEVLLNGIRLKIFFTKSSRS
jgi:hypothetical protein